MRNRFEALVIDSDDEQTHAEREGSCHSVKNEPLTSTQNNFGACGQTDENVALEGHSQNEDALCVVRDELGHQSGVLSAPKSVSDVCSQWEVGGCISESLEAVDSSRSHINVGQMPRTENEVDFRQKRPLFETQSTFIVLPVVGQPSNVAV